LPDLTAEADFEDRERPFWSAVTSSAAPSWVHVTDAGQRSQPSAVCVH
jgi:hypothetical protein